LKAILGEHLDKELGGEGFGLDQYAVAVEYDKVKGCCVHRSGDYT